MRILKLSKKPRQNSIPFFSILAVFILLFSFFNCAKEKKVIRVWQTETDPATLKVLNEITRNFEREYKNVKVEIEGIAWGSMSARLITAIQAGNPPDLAHLQPFWVRSLYEKELLAEIDEVIEKIGKDDIYPILRDLQLFNGHYYGIAHSFNTPVWSYRKDVADLVGLEIPKTWGEYIAFVHKLTAKDKNRYGVILPGGDPFFIYCLLAQFVALNGGQLFDISGRPLFTEKKILECLTFFKKLSEYCPPEWISTKYIDQFRYQIMGNVICAPFTGVRASKQFENDAPPGQNNPENFAVMPPPTGPSGKKSYAILDCEPYVIFKKSKNIALAKDFLNFFFKKDNYLKYCKTVPVHLNPIFRSLNESSEYIEESFVKKWKPWRDLILDYATKGDVRPILVSNLNEVELPFLLEMEGSHIISDMVFDVVREGITPEDAARKATKKAEELIKNLGYKTW